MHRIIAWAILLFLYLALSPRIDFSGVVFGFLIAAAILYLLPAGYAPVRWRRLPSAFFALTAYLVVLMTNMIRSGIQVSKIVMQRDISLDSGIIAFPPECESDLGRALGAHAISLPPGELLIEMNENGTMYIHSLNVPESERQVFTAQAIRKGLLQKIFDR